MKTLFISCAMLVLITAGVFVSAKIYGKEAVQNIFSSESFRNKLALAAGAIMLFTPDSVDKAIVAILAGFGMAPAILKDD